MHIWLLILYFALFSWLTYRQLLTGLMLTAAFLPSYLIRFQIFGVPLTVLEGMILIVTVIWLIKNRDSFSRVTTFTKKLLFERSREHERWWLLTIIVFFLAATISMVISPNTRAALGVWKAYFIEPLLFFSVLISTIKNKQEIKKILYGLATGAAVVALFAVIQKFTGWLIPNPFWQAAATRRVTSFFGYPNAVALYLAPIIPLLVCLLVSLRAKRSNPAEIAAPHQSGARNDVKIVFLTITIILSFLAIIFTRSRGALIALAAATLLWLFSWPKTRKWVLAMLVTLLILWPVLARREQLAEKLLRQDQSNQIRLAMWAETIEMLKTRPLWGAGLAAYQDAVRPFHVLKWAEIYLYPHNLILNFWSETGFLGLLAFITLIYLYFKELRLTKGEGLTMALAMSMMVLLIQGLADVPYFKNDLAVLFWLLIGLTLLNRRIK